MIEVKLPNEKNVAEFLLDLDAGIAIFNRFEYYFFCWDTASHFMDI